MTVHSVVFQPSGRRGEIAEGTTLLEAARQLGADLEGICGAQQSCGKCKVRIEQGDFAGGYGLASRMAHLNPLTAAEERLLSAAECAAGVRLACQARVRGAVLAFVPVQSRRRQPTVRKEITARVRELHPAVEAIRLNVPPATTADARGDADRLLQGLAEARGWTDLKIDACVLRQLPATLRRGAWQVTATVWMGREVIAVQAGEGAALLGAAVDIGTTTVACYLADLTTGKLLAAESGMNPQVAYGEDVLSRITFTMQNAEGLRQLQTVVVEEINRLLARAVGRVGAPAEAVMDMVVVGNTTMHHLFLGLDPRYIGRAPFAPVVQQPLDVKARELGLTLSPGAYVHLLPNEAGFVGADNVGVLIAEEPELRDEVSLIIDVGTNGEIVLGNRQRLLSASCATGPALEGAHIAFGMRAAPGAIERVRVDPQTLEVRYRVIGLDDWQTSYRPEEIGAAGICGSGIIDAVAEMFRCGIICKDGRLNPELRTPRLITGKGQKPEFVLAWAEETSLGAAITISTADIRAVQLAKGALYCGAKLLLKKFGVARPDRVVLAGAFGSYMDKQSALAIGLLPNCNRGNIHSIGNAAGEGALLALLDVGNREKAGRVARQVEYVELATEPDFEREFCQAMHFPHMKDAFDVLH